MFSPRSAVLFHDIEICSDDEVPLQITNYEDELNRKPPLPSPSRSRLE